MFAVMVIITIFEWLLSSKLLSSLSLLSLLQLSLLLPFFLLLFCFCCYLHLIIIIMSYFFRQNMMNVSTCAFVNLSRVVGQYFTTQEPIGNVCFCHIPVIQFHWVWHSPQVGHGHTVKSMRKVLSRLRQNGWYFAEDIFKCIFFNWNWLEFEFE